MPPLETTGRHQKAVLWAAAGVDDYGNATVSSPIELDVRWEERRYESVNPQGQAIGIDATVFVDREVAQGSIMRLGSLAGTPEPPDRLKQVAAYEQVPDVKGRQVQHVVSLVRYSESLPTIAT